MSKEKNQSYLSGWGKTKLPGKEFFGEDLESLPEQAAISRGLGRSYGDSSLPPQDQPLAINTTLADRILSFDQTEGNENAGTMHAEAGLSLHSLNQLYLSKGWFTPVSPGTQFVTLGGMVAADVHGKNQHLDGNFGDHVLRLKMKTADGQVLWCSEKDYADLFKATIGGMGLTGHILEVVFKMHKISSPWIWQETQRIDGIDSFQEALEDAAQKWPYTVGWIDTVTAGKSMGRGILMCGRWATQEEAPKKSPKSLPTPSLPFDFPSWVLNKLSIQTFNTLYFHKHFRKEKRGIVHPETFFYPLDFLRHWNRMYGSNGFTQYQCVLPRQAGRQSAKRILEALVEFGGASFLSVIKDFGKEGKGMLSFPEPGITLALDIPIRKNTSKMIHALNQKVIEEGGRIYLAKDTFTKGSDYRAMDPRVEEFLQVREKWDPNHRFRSAQSVRLFGY